MEAGDCRRRWIKWPQELWLIGITQRRILAEQAGRRRPWCEHLGSASSSAGASAGLRLEAQQQGQLQQSLVVPDPVP